MNCDVEEGSEDIPVMDSITVFTATKFFTHLEDDFCSDNDFCVIPSESEADDDDYSLDNGDYENNLIKGHLKTATESEGKNVGGKENKNLEDKESDYLEERKSEKLEDGKSENLEDVESDNLEESPPCGLKESQIERNVRQPGIFVRKHLKCRVSHSGQAFRKKHLRVYNNYHCCYFCKEKVLHIPVHMKSHRKKIPEVDQELRKSQPDFSRLRRLGDDQNNRETIELGKGEIIIARKSRGTFDVQRYGP